MPPIDQPPDAAVPAVTRDGAPDSAVTAPDAAASSDAIPALVFMDEVTTVGVRPVNPGGEEFEDPCEAGRVLVGLVGTAGPDINGVNSVQARCAELVLGKPRGFGTENPRTLAVHGVAGPDGQDATCPPDQVVVGFEGSTGQWIDRLYVDCAPVSFQSSNRLAVVSVGTATRLPVELGQPAQGILQMVRCEKGKIAVGIRGAAGRAVDWLGLRCARPTLR
jgi:hypothetical protein